MGTERYGTKSSYHHGGLRDALLQHALEIIENEGIAGLTLRKTARHAGVSHAAPAHHFGDMKGMLAALAEMGYRHLVRHMEQAMGDVPEEDQLSKFKAIGTAYIEFAVRNPALFRAMHHAQLSDKTDYPELKKASGRATELVSTAITASQKKRLIRAGDGDLFSIFAWSTVHGFATLTIDGLFAGKGLSYDVAQDAGRVVDLIFTGLRG